MKIQKSHPLSQNTYVLPPLLITPKGNPMSPLKNMAAPSPAKTHAHEIHEKAGSISNICAREPLRDDMNKRLSTKPGGGQTAHVKRWIIRMHIIMTAANCSRAVGSRRAKGGGVRGEEGLQLSIIHLFFTGCVRGCLTIRRQSGKKHLDSLVSGSVNRTGPPLPPQTDIFPNKTEVVSRASFSFIKHIFYTGYKILTVHSFTGS